MTTPFEREILTHYWTSPDRFPRETPLYHKLVDKFLKIGLLRRLEVTNTYGSTLSGTTEAMRVYQAALAAVPFPVQEWRIPS